MAVLTPKSCTEQDDFINSKYPKSFPLFGNLCRKYRSIHKDIDTDEVMDKYDELYVSDETGQNFMCLMKLVIHLSL